MAECKIEPRCTFEDIYSYVAVLKVPFLVQIEGFPAVDLIILQSYIQLNHVYFCQTICCYEL